MPLLYIILAKLQEPSNTHEQPSNQSEVLFSTIKKEKTEKKERKETKLMYSNRRTLITLMNEVILNREV